MPYIYSTEGKIKEPNLAAEAGQGLLGAVTSYARGDMMGAFKGLGGLVSIATGSNKKASEHAKRTKTSPADVVRQQIPRLQQLSLIVNLVRALKDLLERLQGHPDQR